MSATIGGGPLTIDDCKMVQVIEMLMKDVHELREKHNRLVDRVNALETENKERSARVKSMVGENGRIN